MKLSSSFAKPTFLKEAWRNRSNTLLGPHHDFKRGAKNVVSKVAHHGVPRLDTTCFGPLI